MTTQPSNDAPPRRGCGRRAFWILGAVLIGMPLSCLALLSELDRSKRFGPSEICRSNLKQFGPALMMYAEDYDDRFPPAAYVEGIRSVTVPSLLAPYVKLERIWECPTDLQNGRKNGTYDGSPDDTTVGYGYNGQSLAPGGKGVKSAQVKQPANTVAFAESDSYLVTPPGLVAALGGTPPVYRHGSGEAASLRINVAWLDGHVKAEAPGKLEEIGTQEAGKRLGSGIDAFRYWNRW